jgi:hypothetical protein
MRVGLLIMQRPTRVHSCGTRAPAGTMGSERWQVRDSRMQDGRKIGSSASTLGVGGERVYEDEMCRWVWEAGWVSLPAPQPEHRVRLGG